ncbi:hypothetical protein DN730_09980 [Marinomonas piezotolerans]|uniref:Uncharacterized protein n=1 Tax=Marinomonas piezotolerans TaxID=2213058 RepID=A0A370UAC7_9GAMM|nr:hypothetical protein [Marinomonas piezotolerans]RDL44701.1 hypothetical protein DN730_09980 [Marinomonas piezotolerans]
MTFKNIKTADDLAAEQLAREKELQIKDARALLSSTDWVITKIGEARITGADDTALIEKYASVLAEREEARQLINELES